MSNYSYNFTIIQGNVLNDETTAMQRINKLIDPEIDFDTTVYPQSFKCDRGDHSDIYIARRTLQRYFWEPSIMCFVNHK